MTRLSLPRITVRGQQRQGPRSAARSLALEPLEARIVLSGMSEVVGLDAPAETSSESQTTVIDTTVQAAPESVAPVYMADDGVLHVQPAAEETNIVVRQFVDYQLQEVVEVEMGGVWTAFPVAQVQEIQVHKIDVNQQVDIAAGVMVPVQLIDPTAVDAAFTGSESDLLAGEPVETAVTTLAPPADSGPEGEDPTGSSQTPDLAPPVISDFSSNEEAGFWEFTGKVTDDKDVNGLVVRFGGLLSGKTAVVNSDGFFFITATFPPNTTGGVTAITTDGDGLDSNQAFVWLIN